MILLLRADVEDDVGDRQNAMQLFAVGQIVAVEVGRIDEDLLQQGRAVVGGQPAVLQGRVEAVRLDGFVVVDDRIARRGPLERRLGDGAAGEGVEQRRFADAGAAHEHDDQQRLIQLQRFGLAAQVARQPFERRTLQRREGVTIWSIEPGTQSAFELAQGRGEGSQDGFGG